MPIFIASSIAPRNSGTFFLLDDKYLRGGFQVRDTVAERDAIESFNRKEGMLVYTLDDKKLNQLQADLVTWVEFTTPVGVHLHAPTDISTDATHRFVTDEDMVTWSAKQNDLKFTPENSANKGVADGYASLDALGKVPATQMPDLSITDTFVAIDQTAMLALTCQQGDVAVRTDESKTYILAGSDPSILANWQELLSPTDGVLSITAVEPLSNSGTAQAPVLSVALVSTEADGIMGHEDKIKLNSIEGGANNYIHPVGDGNLHVPATGVTSNGKVLTAGATEGSMAWADLPVSLSGLTANAPLISSGGVAPTLSLPAADIANDGYLTKEDWASFNSKGTGTVTSVSGTGPIAVINGATTPVVSISNATASTDGAMSAADKSKLDGIASGATAYVHPTGDGNLHVPATGTSNNGKVLTAGATAGSLSWTIPAASGVTSVSGTGTASGLTLSGTVTSTGNLTLSGTVNSLDPASNIQVNSLGVGTAASASAGEIRATGDVTAFYSDGRLKDILSVIPGALDKVLALRGVRFVNNSVAHQFGYTSREVQVGVIAQEVQAVLPEIVVPAPFDIAVGQNGFEYSKSGENYLTVKYEKLVPLLIEAIKVLNAKVEALHSQLNP